MTYRERNEHKYTKALFNTGDIQICSYCGEPADTKDHVFPIRWADNQEEGHMIIVPACRSCNSMAGHKKFTDIYEKVKWLHEHIKSKYESILHMPDWSEEELKEISFELRQQIEQQLKLRDRIWARVYWGKDIIKRVEK